MNGTLRVFSAGVVGRLVQRTVEDWNRQNPDRPFELRMGGSVEGLRRVLGGEPFDLLISADDSLLESLQAIESIDGYRVFAGNKMVLETRPGREISSRDWREKLLAPTARFRHKNPYDDPGGYRAVMAMMLADRHEPGLSEKLLRHPGRQGPEAGRETPFDYHFTYYSAALAQGHSFAELPPVMNLSDPDLADIYATVEFPVDDRRTVKGAPIAHALAIPKSSGKHSSVREFAELFLSTDFTAHGFLPRDRRTGSWR
jgi:molybdate/tungstate transport system substrate-binding protein